jgi:microsomal dipeptidase-like Zn-dependent dipeptidase
MKLHSLAAILALAGCIAGSDELQDAQRTEAELKVIEASHANYGEVCDAQRRVADAWLKALDQKRYELAKSVAFITCTRADQVGRLAPYS